MTQDDIDMTLKECNNKVNVALQSKQYRKKIEVNQSARKLVKSAVGLAVISLMITMAAGKYEMDWLLFFSGFFMILSFGIVI